MKTIIALLAALTLGANAATYTTEVSALTNPASGNLMDREKVIKVHLMPPTTAGQTNYYLRWNGETSGSWQGGGATVGIAYGQAEVVHTISAKTLGLQPWGAGEGAGYRYTRRLNDSNGTDLETFGYTMFSGPFNATAGNGNVEWGWDAAEVTAQTVHIYFGGANPNKTAKVRMAVLSTCEEPQPFTFKYGTASQLLTPPSGTVEAPSEAITMSASFEVPSIVGSTPWSIITADGNMIDHGTAADAYLVNSGGIEVGHRVNLINPVRITCPAAPPPPSTTETTDANTGTTTTNTTSTPPPTTVGPTAGGGTTTQTNETSTPAPPADGGATPPPTSYKDQKTQYTGAANPDSAEMKKQDFYDATKQALKDAGNSGSSGPGSAPPGAGDVEDISQDDKGETENVQAKMDQAHTKVEAVKDGFIAKLGNVNLTGLPSSVGTASSLNFATFDLGGAGSQNLTVNLTSGPMASAVSMFRTAVLFGLTIAWIFAMVATAKSTFGG